MWIVKQIQEADYGCEERMPGETLMVLVTLESDDRRIIQFEVSDDWLRIQEIDEGDEWPGDIEEAEQKDDITERARQQNQWMDDYLEALSEMNYEI